MYILYGIFQVAILYGFYMLGNGIQKLIDIPIPGSILGMLLLFLLLYFHVVPVRLIEKGAQFFNKYLSLFFIPATVGVMDYFDVFKGSGIVLIAITIGSTLVVMVAAGKTSQRLTARKSPDRLEENN